MQAAVDVRAERDAVWVDLAHLGQAEDLEAARVGEHRARPAHEAVQAAKVGDQLGARPQVEMVGVAQDQAGAQLVQVARGQRLDGRLRADRGKNGCLELAVRGLEEAGTGRGVWVGSGDLEWNI